jgi:succinate dehydrogenase / fumarate reductase cytochrome b subunit
MSKSVLQPWACSDIPPEIEVYRPKVVARGDCDATKLSLTDLNIRFHSGLVTRPVSEQAMPRTTPAERPLSPHLSIYKPSITMTMSIFHRVTGAALFFGTMLLVGLLVALAVGQDAYGIVQGVYGSVFGKLVLLGYTWALFHHMLGGLRHLIWDTGAMLEREVRLKLAWATLFGSLALTVVVWAIFLMR